jgi:hypothetical protein
MRTFKWDDNINTDLAEMELVWTGLICLRLGTNEGLFEHDNDLPVSTTSVNFFTS